MPRSSSSGTFGSTDGIDTPKSGANTPPTDPRLADNTITGSSSNNNNNNSMNAARQNLGPEHTDSPSLRPGQRMTANHLDWRGYTSPVPMPIFPPTYRARQQRDDQQQDRPADRHQFEATTSVPAAPIRQPANPPLNTAPYTTHRQAAESMAPYQSLFDNLVPGFGNLQVGSQGGAAASVAAPATPAPLAAGPSTVWPRPQLPVREPPAFLNSWLANTRSEQSSNPATSPRLAQSVISDDHGAASPRGFRPMAAISHNPHRNNHPQRPFDNRLSRPATHSAAPSAFSENYRGEHSSRNASVEDLPTEQNCALWLTNLPPNVTYHQLLGQIRNVGRIWCAVINEPDYVRHSTAAAKVVFFTPEAAQLLLSKSLTQGLSVGGYSVTVKHNRVKYREESTVGNASRVLIVTGKSDFVNPESLTDFFKRRFVFEVDDVTELIVHGAKGQGGRSVVEYKFGSFRCQAQMGKMALEKDRPEGFEKVEFGPDPCEVGDTLSSYGIAAERIQGRGI
ncbi:hypothetical protein ACJ41O_001126 [Fusarium nematophilum]